MNPLLLPKNCIQISTFCVCAFLTGCAGIEGRVSGQGVNVAVDSSRKVGKGGKTEKAGDGEAAARDAAWPLEEAKEALAKNDFETALRALDAALAANPRDAATLLLRARLHAQRREVALAKRDLEEAVRRDRFDPEVCRSAAWIYAVSDLDELRDGARAEVLARQACELTQWTEPRSLAILAAACAELGNFAEAQKWQNRSATFTGDEDPEASKRAAFYEEKRPWRLSIRVK